MAFKEQYERRIQKLLSDRGVCPENRRLFREFFAYEEYKLKRQNGLRVLDEASYKTLCYYVTRFSNVNAWFGNKPWTRLTRADIKRVYDALEDGAITNSRGKPFADRDGYYNKVFKSKPFRLAGKEALAKEVIEFSTRTPRQVRYIDESAFLTLVSVLSNPRHLLLFWLAWDVGENISTLLALRKRHFLRQTNPDAHEPEYLVNFPREHLKRSRRQRGEVTLYAETVRWADIALTGLGDDDPVFPFGHRQALKVLKQAATKTGAASLPDRGTISWKDFRSGMACHLLRHGWSIEEINSRLGHTPSSRAIDAYVSHLAIARHAPKKRLHDFALQRFQQRLEAGQSQQKLLSERLRRQSERGDRLEEELRRTRRDLKVIRERVEHVAARLSA